MYLIIDQSISLFLWTLAYSASPEPEEDLTLAFYPYSKYFTKLAILKG